LCGIIKGVIIVSDMTKSLNVKFEQAVSLLIQHMPVSDESSRKPIIFHDIRVGVYLYNQGYSENIVLAGLLHDTIEWSSATKEMIEKEFGSLVLKLILANTKDDSISDKAEKTTELITRCIGVGLEALIIKAADILDSYRWYSSQESIDQLKYCQRNADAIFKYKPANFNDKIFDELNQWRGKYSDLSE